MDVTIPVTQARKDFFKLITAADRTGASVTITLNGRPKAVIMSVEDFEGWQETLEIFADSELVKGIKQGLHDVKTGKIYNERDVKKKLNLNE